MSDKDLDPGVETEEAKAPEPPHRLKRIRVCGKWQEPGYKPSKKEVAEYEERCKQRGLDPKTGKPVAKKAAAKK